jgi:hypothetical protein
MYSVDLTAGAPLPARHHPDELEGEAAVLGGREEAAGRVLQLQDQAQAQRRRLDGLKNATVDPDSTFFSLICRTILLNL